MQNWTNRGVDIVTSWKSSLYCSQHFLEEIIHHKEPIVDSLNKADRFIHNNKDDYLKAEQQQEITSKMGDLRKGYDTVVRLAEDRLQDLKSTLTHRNKEKEEMVRRW